ncbi:MAG: Rossmann-like and DUF2520 domain-containing protein [Pyrinomonadaceae bacterium]
MSGTRGKRKPKPSVSIVGSGRLGTALAIALSSLGYQIRSVVTRRQARAKRAASLVGDATAALTADRLNLMPPSQIVFITTPDDIIGPTVERLAKLQEQTLSGRVVLHVSGALSSDILGPLARKGSHVGSLHPLISVSDPQTGAASLPGAFYCVEGDLVATQTARRIVRDLKGEAFSIAGKDKPLYHAAAVMASGHVVALFDLAIEMLMQCGLSRGRARRALLPLLESTMNNLSKFDPARALTGTFARADIATVQKHLQALSKNNSSRAAEVYRALGMHALDFMNQNGVAAGIVSEIRNVLEPPKKQSMGSR